LKPKLKSKEILFKIIELWDTVDTDNEDWPDTFVTELDEIFIEYGIDYDWILKNIHGVN